MTETPGKGAAPPGHTDWIPEARPCLIVDNPHLHRPGSAGRATPLHSPQNQRLASTFLWQLRTQQCDHFIKQEARWPLSIRGLWAAQGRRKSIFPFSSAQQTFIERLLQPGLCCAQWALGRNPKPSSPLSTHCPSIHPSGKASWSWHLADFISQILPPTRWGSGSWEDPPRSGIEEDVPRASASRGTVLLTEHRALRGWAPGAGTSGRGTGTQGPCVLWSTLQGASAPLGLARLNDDHSG